MADIARNDTATVAAIGVLGAVVVTVTHEAVGHGSVCLALGGRVTLLTSSLFRCDVPSYVIDLGGPLMNMAVGLAAALVSRIVSGARPALKLFLTLIAAFAGFWEGGYLVQALLTRHGDLYSAWVGLIGEPSVAVRVVGAFVGVAIYLATWRFAARSLGSLAEASEARRTARTVWIAATLATVGAALLYRGGVGANLRDAFMEIGVASLPLLLIPRRASSVVSAHPIRRNLATMGAAVVVLAVFALTIGRGYGAV